MNWIKLNSLTVLVLLILTNVSAFGKIHHEHITTVPNYDDYVLAFKQIGADLSQVRVEKISEDPAKSLGEIFGKSVLPSLKEQFGMKPDALDSELSEKLKLLTFRDMATQVKVALNRQGVSHLTVGEVTVGEVTVDNVMRTCFEYTPLSGDNRGDWAYMSIGWDFRLYAQDILMEAKNGAVYLFRNFLKRTPVSQRTVVSITANAFHEFFKPENAKIMADVRKEFFKAGSELEWIGGVTRAQIQKVDPAAADPHARFNESMDKFRELLQQGQISGMDITGSIVENSRKYMDLEERTEAVLFERLQIILSTLADKRGRGQLKIHMYESTPDGEFYDIFFKSLKAQLAKKGVTGIPPIIRVGHVSALRPQDIARFEELSQIKDRFVFEANLDSNMNLKSATAEKIAGIINLLIEKKYKVRLGTDGLGIFGEVAYFNSTLQRLIDAGLSVEAVKHLK